MEVLVDWEKAGTKEEAHAVISGAMGFPEYYGGNLDALWDALTERDIPTRLVMENSCLLPERLGQYGCRMLRTIYEAAEENPALTVEAR